MQYLSRHSGHSNAFTSTTNTNYYFNVATSALPGALARFAAFFHSPLFAPSCTTRELNAVNSEHKKNQQNDLWRIYQVNKHLSRPGHVWRKFGSGNKDSLTRVGRELKAKSGADSGNLRKTASLAATPAFAGRSLTPSPVPSRVASPAPSVSSVSSEADADGGVVGRETRRRLVEWWSEEYCASRMRLCVIGKGTYFDTASVAGARLIVCALDPLDELEAMVVENFSPILDRGRDPLPIIPENPFGPNEKGVSSSLKNFMLWYGSHLPISDACFRSDGHGFSLHGDLFPSCMAAPAMEV